MAENLEASGFENGQALSIIEAIAVSIERFAVTPKVLAREFAKQNKEIDRRFAEQSKEFNRRMAAQDKAWNTHFAEQDNTWNTRFAEQNADMNRQFTELRAVIKSIGTRQFAMMWGVIVMMLGLLATSFMQQVL